MNLQDRQPSVCAVSTLTSQPTSEPPENQRRNNTQAQAHKSKQAISPPDTKHTVHSRREEREREARHGPHKGCCTSCAGRVCRVGIDNICLSTVEADDKADCEDACAKVWDKPMDPALGGPAVDEEADGNEQTEGEEQREAILW